MQTEWQKANEWERNWHGNCANSFNEEKKQYEYAKLMGLDKYATHFYGGKKGWDFKDLSVIDVGCGPYSILMKSKGKSLFGVDPCPYPEWVKMRYEDCGITFLNNKAEQLIIRYNFGSSEHDTFDIGIIYNCLQHTENPEKIIQNMRKCCKVIHIFEWIDTGLADGHIHDLKEDKLNQWLGGVGAVRDLNQEGLVGRGYFGIFKGGYEEPKIETETVVKEVKPHGTVNILVKKSYLVKFVDPNKMYPVSYTFNPDGSVNKEPFLLKGEDLTENQILELFQNQLL